MHCNTVPTRHYRLGVTKKGWLAGSFTSSFLAMKNDGDIFSSSSTHKKKGRKKTPKADFAPENEQ